MNDNIITMTFEGELTPEDCKRIGIKEYELSEEAKKEIEEIERYIVR